MQLLQVVHTHTVLSKYLQPHFLNMCPTPGTYKLTLSTTLDKTGLTTQFTNVDTDLGDNAQGTPATYQSAISDQGTWILYSEKNYNDDHPDKGKIQIIRQGETKLLDFQPKSVRPLTSAANTVSLFEHKNYGGLRVQITRNTPSLTEFPAFNKAGISSLVINPTRKWTFFVGPNYSGQSFTLGPDEYIDPSTFHGQDEKIQSIKIA